MNRETRETNQPLVVPLWPDGAQGVGQWTEPEEETIFRGDIKVIRNVREPTLTAYLPEKSLATGTAVVVCPGGAFHFLSIEMEGTDVARWLNGKGIAAFVLKYRLIQTGDDFQEVVDRNLSDNNAMERLMTPLLPMILADGQQAIATVRARASEWSIDPDRIGIIGFSAGSTVTVNVALEHDAASRPSFAAAIYHAGNRDVPVPEDAPPLFILCADDDKMAAPLSERLYEAWRSASRPVELHIYAKGGHGFGMRTQGLPSDRWIDRLYEWLCCQE